MTAEELKVKTKDEIMDFIRKRLSFDEGTAGSIRQSETERKQHKRFDMSGYESKTGQCTVWNASVLNEFADLGIYDYTSYLFLDFYKGNPRLYLKYFNENENLEFDEWGGYGTTEIIYKIFELTIFSNKGKRRRI
ncbi:hypothetical protein [Chryseobacterium sp.]|uniref:hypothetical protein n=1 Tax=Chryseobacterium sp. TaxID=1871047 RepID=UPI0011CC9653|nr:hypothetical protein [Chryseobacterium sp.]TXF79585.1 hypothetical protein FUA25_04165 [Chryseobacterium sp.]